MTSDKTQLLWQYYIYLIHKYIPGASFSGVLRSEGLNIATGDYSASYQITTNRRQVGKGSLSLNMNTGTIQSLTFNEKKLLPSAGISLSPPKVSSLPPLGPEALAPFSAEWTANPTGQSGGISGNIQVTLQGGRTDSINYQFNFLDGSTPQISVNGRDVGNIFSSGLTTFAG